MTTQADKVRSVARQTFNHQVDTLTKAEREAVNKAIKEMQEALPIREKAFLATLEK